MQIKIAAVQMNPIVGDIQGNYDKIIAAYTEAAAAGADMVVTPEMSLTGYPLEDLVLRKSFITEVENFKQRLIDAVNDLDLKATLIFGAPGIEGDGVTNNAYVVDPTEPRRAHNDAAYSNVHKVMKTELPNYGVFDEKRVFVPSSYENRAFHWRGHRIGLMICEDAWFPKVTKQLADTSACLLIAVNGSPFEFGKNVVRRQVIAKRIKEAKVPFLYVNLVGGQDELVFDGGSFFYDGRGVQEAPHFIEGIFYFETTLTPINKPVTLDNYPHVKSTALREIYQAKVMGMRDFWHKQGFAKGVEGMSGGVDSALAGAIAVDALGKPNVLLVRMPTKFSSQHSLDDAAEAAKLLGVFDTMRTINIEPVVQAHRDLYNSSRPADQHIRGTADENLQSRVRGDQLAIISNQEGYLIFNTGNKSENSVGYFTTASANDANGAFNTLKDSYKSTIFDLCRWRNTLTQADIDEMGFLGNPGTVIPPQIITKPPSAELAEGQLDTNSLPPYHVLDAILICLIEDDRGVDETYELLKGPEVDLPLIIRIRNLIDRAEFKRRQTSPGVKLTSKIHGRDRRVPIVNRWRK